jgi:hypothetical protein
MENNKEYHYDEQTVMALVDSMAQAATVFAGHGYEQFIQAREAVKSVVHSLYEDTLQK